MPQSMLQWGKAFLTIAIVGGVIRISGIDGWLDAQVSRFRAAGPATS